VSTYGPIAACQTCGERDLRPVLFLGYLPPVNTMRRIGTLLDAETAYPAEVVVCRRCHLVQLTYAVDPSILFPPDYPYTSGSTRILRENFANLYQECSQRLGLRKDALVLDIGSNDGTLLSNFAAAGHRVLGIEPSLTAKIAQERGIPTLMTFFARDAVDRALREHGHPQVVTATNVFAHIHGVGELLENIERLVGEDSVFISESHYLGSLVETLQYDTIYHEHLRYYSLTSLRNLLATRGFRVFHVSKIPTHGGSIRVYASKSPKRTADPSVERLLAEESASGLTSGAWIEEFRRRITRSKLRLYELLAKLKAGGSAIYGIGAPSRASTLVNYVGLDDGIMECVLEIKGSLKIGKYMPGTKIPISEESKLYADQPPYVLLLSWHIADELCRNLKRRGYRGDFIVPLPEPRVVQNSQAPA
jgi:SAM-dependent methyltransferase